jgi:hypothetical protein
MKRNRAQRANLLAMTTHLIMSYSYPGGWRTPDDVATPHAACRAADPQDAMVDIYSGGDESAIDCEGCLAWLNAGDNRMLLLDVDKWIRKHAADEDLRYIDI